MAVFPFRFALHVGVQSTGGKAEGRGDFAGDVRLLGEVIVGTQCRAASAKGRLYISRTVSSCVP